MQVWILLILVTVGSLVSLTGGFLLLSNKRLANGVAKYCGPFAAGALIAAVFADLLPEAFDINSSNKNTLVWAAIGIILFFILERRLRWFHHHHEHPEEIEKDRVPIMLLVGGVLHNAIDGIAIAFAFLANPGIGVVTTIAVSLHELPKEIGDFGLMLAAGWSRRKVIFANLLGAFSTIVAAMIIYLIGKGHDAFVGPALALTAGTLLYIALSDIVPSVHEQLPKHKWLDAPTLLLVAGAVIVWLAVHFSHLIEG